MQILYGINQIKKFRNPVVALGVFDGVHRGHQKILRAAVNKARAIKGTSVVVTFEPHPQEEESLYSLEHRLRLIAETGIQVSVVIDFTQHFANMGAVDFIKNILAQKLGARYIYVGKNFKFGRNATGNPALLKKLGASCGFRAKGIPILKISGRPVSSTIIRNLIKSGKLGQAQKFLGRRVSILGTVIKGTKLGRIIGFPTANINPHHEVIPPDGIYSTMVIFDGREYKGACYIGKRPTIIAQSVKSKAQNKRRIEVHILNFKKNIYGKYLDIQFIEKLRRDKKFACLTDLSKQIRLDLHNL